MIGMSACALPAGGVNVDVFILTQLFQHMAILVDNTFVCVYTISNAGLNEGIMPHLITAINTVWTWDGLANVLVVWMTLCESMCSGVCC